VTSEQQPLPVWEPTGEPSVDAALELLVIAEEVPVEEQQPIFEDVHAQLRQALSGEASGDATGPA
jgi:hypothetical protein